MCRRVEKVLLLPRPRCRAAGALVLLGEDLVQVDRAALQDLHRDFVALLIGAGQAVALVVQDKLQDGTQLRLDGPVLADAVPPVEVHLAHQVVLARARGEHLDDEVRRAVAAPTKSSLPGQSIIFSFFPFHST